MHKSTSAKRKSFSLYAVLSAFALVGGASAALFAGVTPAAAANLASQVDTQIAVFMVPLTLLVLAIMFEVTRVVVRGTVPVDATPRRRQAVRQWAKDHGER